MKLSILVALFLLLAGSMLGCREKDPQNAGSRPAEAPSLQQRLDARLAQSLSDQELTEVRAALGKDAVEKGTTVGDALGKINRVIDSLDPKNDFERFGQTREARLLQKKRLAELLELKEKLRAGYTVGTQALMARQDFEKEEREMEAKRARSLTDAELRKINVILVVQEGATVGDAMTKIALKIGSLNSDTPRTPEERQIAEENPEEWQRRKLSYIKVLLDLEEELLNPR